MLLWRIVARDLTPHPWRKHVYAYEVLDAILAEVEKDPSLTPEQRAQAPKAIANMLQWDLNGDN